MQDKQVHKKRSNVSSIFNMHGATQDWVHSQTMAGKGVNSPPTCYLSCI